MTENKPKSRNNCNELEKLKFSDYLKLGGFIFSILVIIIFFLLLLGLEGVSL